MNPRQSTILRYLVEDYIRSVEPVSSGALVKKFCLPWSSATVRNDLVELEEKEFIHQLYAVSGRVPTAKAYRYFVDNFLDLSSLDVDVVKEISRAIQKGNRENILRVLAEAVSEISGMVSFISRESDHSFYICGLGRVFSEPEFHEFSYLQRFGRMLDNLYNEADYFFDVLDLNSPRIFIGDEGGMDFGADEYSLVVSLTRGSRLGEPVILGLAGPQRMDYRKNQILVDYCRKVLEEEHY